MTSLANKRSLVAIFMVLSMVLFRPSILGGDSTVFGLALMLLVYTYNNVVCARGRYSDRFVGSNEFLFWVWVCVYSVYCLLLTLVQGDSDLGFALKGLVSLVVSVFLFASVVSDKNMAQVIFRYFAILNSFLGWSIAVTLLLLNIVPYESLHLFSVSVQSYEEVEFNGDILFPFSAVYSFMTEYGIYRFSGLAREAGIGQAFFTWSFFYFHINKSSKWWSIGCLIGVFLCGSTTGAGVFAFAILIYYVFEKNISTKSILAISAIFVGVILLAIYMPGFGLADKQTTHAASFEDRQLAMEYVADNIWSLFFGNGLFYKFAPYANMGVNAIGQIYYYGVVGFVMFVATFFVRYAIQPGAGKNYFVLIFPFLITALFVQPLVEAPLMYFIFMFDPNLHYASAED